MGTFLKQPRQRGQTTRKAKEANPAPVDRVAKYAESDQRHSGCMEEALDRLRSVISTYVTQAREGDNGSGLYSEPSGNPVKVSLQFDETEYGQTLEILIQREAVQALTSIADSFKRIADTVAAK